jgi:hypothetical protein
MRASSFAIAMMLVACGGNKDDANKQRPPAKVAEKHTVDAVRMHVPEGWKAEYDAGNDTWRFTSPPIQDRRTISVILERTPPQTTAAPEALRHYLETKSWAKGTTAEIEKREALSDGFAAILLVKSAADPVHPTRQVYVIKELGSEWFRCFSTSVDDDAMRDQVLALCKSIKR